MDFDLSEEQVLLQDMVRRWSNDRYGSLEAVMAAKGQPRGHGQQTWQELAELGVLGLPFAEEDGGIGGGPVETLIVMEALGRALAPEPYLASTILAGSAIRLAPTSDLRTTLITGLVDGTAPAALAYAEPQARYDVWDTATVATRQGDDLVVSGRKVRVLDADVARNLVVSVRTDGGRRDRGGVTLVVVPTDAPGVTVMSYPTQDERHAASVTLDGVRLSHDAVLGAVGSGTDLLERAVGHGIAALAAEAVGIMQALHDLTLAYLKERRQFGTTIGSFQALQHRSVDMFIALEQARSMAFYAAMMVNADDGREAALSAVKVQINQSARLVGQQSVQLHGGIGLTREYLGAHYFRRLTVIESLFGDTPHHLRRVAA